MPQPNQDFCGRPKIEFNIQDLIDLMQFYPTLSEAACWFNCSEDTIERRVREIFDLGFADFRHRYSGKTRLLLKRKAISLALETDDKKMLIYCLRSLTDMNDKPKSEPNEGYKEIRLAYTESLL